MKSVTCGSTETSSDGSAVPNPGISECGCAVERGRSDEIVSAPFIEGQVASPAGAIPRVKTSLEVGDVLGRWQRRWGIGRGRFRIAPGLYAAGNPEADSPVLVTANYKLTFDAVRRELNGLDAWILVLETNGVNVWCAAGKGTFGTDELVRRVQATRLEEVVGHRKLVVPQLGATGVAAHEVRKKSGFSVVYGPVRAEDIKPFLAAGMKTTPEMRRVAFGTVDRLVLAPMELVAMLKKPTAMVALLVFVLGGIGPGIFSVVDSWHRGLGALGVWLTGLLAGAVATPVLLPWIPGRAFAAKGALVGAIVAGWVTIRYWEVLGALQGVALLLALPAVASYVAMNFTGASTFTSPSGVEKEMRRAIPAQAVAVAVAGIAWLGSAFVN
jgi:hypothetical protein